MTDTEKIAVKALEDIKKHTEIMMPVGWYFSATWKMATNALEAIRRLNELHPDIRGGK